MALILFVEYHATFRQAASYLMNREPDLEVVAQGGSVAEGREQMARGGIDAASWTYPSPTKGPRRWSATFAGPTPPCRCW